MHNYKQLGLTENTLSVPVPCTKEILQKSQREMAAKLFFFLCPILGYLFRKPHLTLLHERESGLPQAAWPLRLLFRHRDSRFRTQLRKGEVHRRRRES